MRAYLLILLIPSIALLFLPYTGAVSPVSIVLAPGWWAWDSPLPLLGGPFFLSIPILIAQTRVVLKRPFSKGERATYRLLACVALGAGLVFWGLLFRRGFSKEDIQYGLVWCVSCTAAVWMMTLSARKLNPEEATTVMLKAAWLPNAILCAVAFWGENFFNRGWEIGAYLAAFTIVLYTVEITLSMRGKRQTLSTLLVSPS